MATPRTGSAGILGLGCVAVELDARDPPALRRDSGGTLRVRARRTAASDAGRHTGACTYGPDSATGIVTVAATTSNGLQAELPVTGTRPMSSRHGATPTGPGAAST